ncbi:hypothetical protein V6N13_036553 [Hibiscus sabdariffa]
MMKFTGKLVDHFDNLDVDTMSMFEVVSMVERLGFVVTVNVFWQLSDNPLEVKKLISDGDVLEMVRNVPSDHYLHIYIVEVEHASRIESDSNLEDEDCDVEPETRIESDSNSKEVEPETRIESDSNSEDEEYEVEDESSTDQSKFSDSENELVCSEDEIFNVNVGLGSDEVEAAPVNGEDLATGSWQIRSVNGEHTCLREFQNHNVTAKWLAENYFSSFYVDPNFSHNSLKQIVHKDWGIHVPKTKCIRTKNLAIENLNGNHKEQYAKLYAYLDELRQSNPGTTTVCKLDERKFERLYICMQAMKDGFKAGCRPIIGLDGCHLKGYYQGHLLPAVGIDADDSIYPISFAVVESENQSSWCWFLELLATDLEIENSHSFTFMTDRQKLILEARDKPIITLIESIRTKLMQRLAKRKDQVEKWTGLLCPKIHKKLDNATSLAHSCWHLYAGGQMYQVSCGPSSQHSVNIQEWTCSCRKWQLTGVKEGVSGYFVKKCGGSGHNIKTCKGKVGVNLKRSGQTSSSAATRTPRIPKLPLKDMDLEPPQQVRLQQLKFQVQLQQNLHSPMFLDGCPPLQFVRVRIVLLVTHLLVQHQYQLSLHIPMFSA